MILGGDLGGTKTLLALAEVVDGRIDRSSATLFPAPITAILTTCSTSFSPTDRPTVTSACFGVAGPTDGQTAQLTYLPWSLAAQAIWPSVSVSPR
jgi:glucokinase